MKGGSMSSRLSRLCLLPPDDALDTRERHTGKPSLPLGVPAAMHLLVTCDRPGGLNLSPTWDNTTSIMQTNVVFTEAACAVVHKGAATILQSTFLNSTMSVICKTELKRACLVRDRLSIHHSQTNVASWLARFTLLLRYTGRTWFESRWKSRAVLNAIRNIRGY